MRVDGDAMIGDGIHSQDLIVVDRSLPLQHKKIAVIVLEGELLLKRVLLQNDKIILSSSNPEYEDIELSAEAQFEVWGIVTAVIHQF
jgi:DNA polymerase V